MNRQPDVGVNTTVTFERTPTHEEVLDILREVYDPDYHDRSVVDMRLVSADDIEIGEEQIEIEYGLTASGAELEVDRRILRRLRSAKSILDVGCGDGRLTTLLAYRTRKRVVGLDISSQGFATAYKTAARRRVAELVE